MIHRATFFLLLGLLVAACANQPSASTGQSPIVDRIVVAYAPSCDFAAADVRTVTIRDPRTISAWVGALSRIPEQPVRGVRLISFRGNPPEHRIELFAGERRVMTHRMKGGQLDVAAHDGWAFYSGEDREFVKLVDGVLPGA